jgi:hypothetical protein
MKIYVTKNLSYISNELQKRGYIIVKEDSDTKYDVIICKVNYYHFEK